jgi:hypothetical protein
MLPDWLHALFLNSQQGIENGLNHEQANKEKQSTSATTSILIQIVNPWKLNQIRIA